MRPARTKTILTACEMAFNGKTNNEIAAELDIHVSAVSRWRKNAIWKEFTEELIAAHKQSLLKGHKSTSLEDGT